MDDQNRHRQDNNENIVEKNGLQNGNSTPIQAGKSCKCHSSNGLHHYNCVPKHLQFNRFVHTGYRAGLSTWDCFKSLFYLHNESFNVYSHGLAAVGLILLSPYFYGKITHQQFDPILYPIHHITSTTCVLFSAIYHLMSCHEGGSEAYRCFITLDYLGIWLVTSLCCITFLKTTLFCFLQVHKVVTGIYFLLCFISLLYVTKGYSPITRMRPLVALGAVRIFILYPTRCIMTHMGYMTGPLATLWYLLGVEMIGLFGGLLNLSRLPERYFQGKKDYFFNSHNIMHLFVLLAPALLHCGTVIDFEWMQSVECPV